MNDSHFVVEALFGEQWLHPAKILLDQLTLYVHDPRRVHYKMFFSVLYFFVERLRVGPGIL